VPHSDCQTVQHPQAKQQTKKYKTRKKERGKKTEAATNEIYVLYQQKEKRKK